MRGVERPETLFSYVSLEDRIPANHPIRKLRAVVDALLRQMDDRIDACYAKRGRPSIPPHRLLRALLLQAIYSIPSERRLVEAIEYNLLYRWFVGLGLDEPVWDHSTFSANRERLLNQEIVQAFFRQVRDYAELRAVLSHEHFSVDGTLIDAWASHKSLAPIDEETGPHQGQGKNPTVDFTGEKRSNATHRSTTDPDARLFRKSAGDKCTSVTQNEAYRSSLKVRKRIEEIFDWVKTVGGLRKARFVGLAKVKVQALIAFAAYNLVRLAKLSGWPLKAT
ncbi:MAG: transposase [Hydrogenophilus thermoluteolus]